MNSKLATNLVCSCLLTLAIPAWSHALTCGTWNDAEKSIRGWWQKAYPNEKVLSIEQNGPPRTYSKVQSTNQKKIDEYGNEWEYYQKNPYCSVPAKVKVQQSSGPRIFSVSSVFKVSGKKFTFDDVAVGNSEAILESGQAAAPGNAEIINLVTEKIVSRIPQDLRSTIKVDKVELVSKPALSRFGEGQSAYSIEKFNLFLTVDGEKQRTCEIMLTNLYKGEEKNMKLDATGPWKVNFTLKDVPSSCVPFKYASKVYDFANNIVAPAPPPVADTSWMKDVVGTYKGDIEDELVNQGTTNLTMGNNGKIAGTFTYTERKFQSEGEIYNCSPVKENELKCSWKNQKGMGMLRFFFDSSHSSFTGRWWGRAEKDNSKWEGKKASGAVSSAGTAKSSDAAPAPNLNKMLKGFGF